MSVSWCPATAGRSGRQDRPADPMWSSAGRSPRWKHRVRRGPLAGRRALASARAARPRARTGAAGCLAEGRRPGSCRGARRARRGRRRQVRAAGRPDRRRGQAVARVLRTRDWSPKLRWPSPRCTGCCDHSGRCATAPGSAGARAAGGVRGGGGGGCRPVPGLGGDAVGADGGGRGRPGAVRRRRCPLARRRLRRRPAVRGPSPGGRPGGAGLRRAGRRCQDVSPRRRSGAGARLRWMRRRRVRCSPSGPGIRWRRRSASSS